MFEEYPRIIEDKYLHNFSQEEKEQLMGATKAYNKRGQKRIQQIDEGIANDSPEVFVTLRNAVPNTAEEIKYVLNRIAANDPRDRSFELCLGDEIKNPNRLALDIAQAFRDNTNCKKVVLRGIGLTDAGMLPILHNLPQDLFVLDIAGNKITDKSLKKLDTILADPKTYWGRVELGTIGLTAERAESFKRYTCIRYKSTRLQKVKASVVDFLFSRPREY